MAFRVGQKVVCVSVERTGQIAPYCGKFDSVVVGSIYTIREIDTRAVHLHGCSALRFEEILREPRMTSVGMWEAAFPATHFRPLIERKKQTDISIFTKLLEGSRQRERA